MLDTAQINRRTQILENKSLDFFVVEVSLTTAALSSTIYTFVPDKDYFLKEIKIDSSAGITPAIGGETLSLVAAWRFVPQLVSTLASGSQEVPNTIVVHAASIIDPAGPEGDQQEIYTFGAGGGIYLERYNPVYFCCQIFQSNPAVVGNFRVFSTLSLLDVGVN